MAEMNHRRLLGSTNTIAVAALATGRIDELCSAA